MAVHQDLSAFGIANRTYSVEEWLAIEERTGERFEYHRGRLLSVRAMAGGSFAHSLIGGNAIGSLFKSLTAEKIDHCGVHTSDLKIYIEHERRYLYADAAVVCGTPTHDARVPTAITNPVVVVEVLSPSSVSYDTGIKFDYYGSLPSLREYVLVMQDDYRVEVRRRSAAGEPWYLTSASSLDDAVTLPSIGVDLPLAEVYRGIEFDDDDEVGGEEGALVA